jgi:hypothetical protein
MLTTAENKKVEEGSSISVGRIPAGAGSQVLIAMPPVLRESLYRTSVPYLPLTSGSVGWRSFFPGF